MPRIVCDISSHYYIRGARFSNFLSITKIVTSIFNVYINVLQNYKSAQVNWKDGNTLAREIASDIKNMTDLKISAVKVSS
jgi:hypothetical protein